MAKDQAVQNRTAGRGGGMLVRQLIAAGATKRADAHSLAVLLTAVQVSFGLPLFLGLCLFEVVPATLDLRTAIPNFQLYTSISSDAWVHRSGLVDVENVETC